MGDRFKLHIRQAVVTALAAVASFYVADFLRLPEAYWAVISSIIVMQSSVGATVGASWNRLAGTALGAFMGALFASLFGTSVWAFGAAVAATVWLCASLGLLESYRLAGVTVSIVMLVSRSQDYGVIALRRFLEVAVGIIVSLVVTALSWPARARRDLRHGIAEALVVMEALYRAILRRYEGERDAPIEALRGSVRDLLRRHDVLLKEAVYEPALGTRPALLALFGEHLKRVLLAIEALELATRDQRKGAKEIRFEPELGDLMLGIGSSFRELEAEVEAGRYREKRNSLAPAVSALDAKIAKLRLSGSTLDFNLDEALRFYAFVSCLRNLARELDWLDVAERG